MDAVQYVRPAQKAPPLLVRTPAFKVCVSHMGCLYRAGETAAGSMPTESGPALQHWGGGSNAPPPLSATGSGYQVCLQPNPRHLEDAVGSLICKSFMLARVVRALSRCRSPCSVLQTVF